MNQQAANQTATPTTTKQGRRMRIPLTIDANYLPEWGVQEGLRELIQNTLDAEDATGQRSSLRYSTRSQPVTLKNPGARLDRDALLMGMTTKADDANARGQFGEGLKLGTLALCRAGAAVRIETSSENWRASLDEHPSFPGRQVLCFDTHRRHSDGDDVVVIKVKGISKEDYAEAKGRFRRLSPAAKEEASFATGYFGEVLLDPKDKGSIYVKGIFVESRDGLAYGYDLKQAKTDRDRRLVNSWDLHYYAAGIITQANKRGALKTRRVFDLLMSGSDEAKNINHHLDATQRAALAERFRFTHGPDAIPCDNHQTARKLESVGLVGIVTNEQAVEVLTPVLGTAASKIREASRKALEEYALGDLTDKERGAFLWAHSNLAAVVYRQAPDAYRPEIKIVRFANPKTIGIHRRLDGGDRVIEIARSVLSSRYRTLSVLIHEVAHLVGADGSKAHTDVIEEISMHLFARFHGDLVSDDEGGE